MKVNEGEEINTVEEKIFNNLMIKVFPKLTEGECHIPADSGQPVEREKENLENSNKKATSHMYEFLKKLANLSNSSSQQQVE